MIETLIHFIRSIINRGESMMKECFERKLNVKNLLKKMSFLFGILSFSIIGIAQADDVRLGMPGYGGNGCPLNSASVTLTEDKKTLSIIFDQFIVEAGGVNKLIERKSCNIAIPVHIPQGLSVSIIAVDYRGYVSLPEGANARLTAEYFLAGSRGPKFDKLFIGQTDTDYTFGNKLEISGMIWSPCGADTNLRVNAAMLVKTNDWREEALATVDSADFKAGLVYHLAFRPCRI